MIIRFLRDNLRRTLPALVIASLLLQPLATFGQGAPSACPTGFSYDGAGSCLNPNNPSESVLAQCGNGLVVNSDGTCVPPNQTSQPSSRQTLMPLAFIGVNVQLSGSTPELYLTNLPETCTTNVGDAKLVVTASFDATNRVKEFSFSQLQHVANGDRLIYSFSHEAPRNYNDGWFRFALSQPVAGCAAPSSVNFRPELPPPAGDFQSEFSSVQPRGSVGDAIKGFVFSTVVDSLLGVITGKVPVGDSGVTKAIGNSISKSFESSLNQLKQDLIQSLRQAAATIAQQIFSTVSGKLMQQFSKLAIKDPSLHKLLNTLGGVYLGIQSFQRRGCIDPATVACYQAAVTNAVNGVKAQSGNARARTNADLILAASFRGMRRCPTSRIDSILGGGRATPIPGAVSMRSIFGKLPFFAQAFESGRARNPLTAQVTGFVPGGRGVPTGNFVTAGLANIATAQMCGDITTRLSSSINLAVDQQLEKIKGELANGIQGVKRCKRWLGNGSTGGFSGDQLNCVEWEEVTPSGVVLASASRLAQAPIDVAIKQIADPPQQEALKTIRNFLADFINGKVLKVSQILLTQRGLVYGSEVAETPNREVVSQSERRNIEEACGSQGAFSQQAFDACVQARQQQTNIIAHSLSTNEIHDLQERYRQVVTRLRNVRAEFTRLNEPSSNPEEDRLMDRTRTAVTTNTDRLVEARRNDVIFTPEGLDRFGQLDTQYSNLAANFASILSRLTGTVPSDHLGEALNQYQALQNPIAPDRLALATLESQTRVLQAEIQTERTAIQEAIQGINASVGTFQSIAFSGGLGGQRPTLTSATDLTDTPPHYQPLFLGGVTIGTIPQPNPQLAAQLSDINADLSQHYQDTCLQTNWRGSCSQTFSAKDRFQNDLFYLAIRQPLLPQSNFHPGNLLQDIVNLIQAASDEQRPATAAQLQGLTTIQPYLQQAATAIGVAQSYGAGHIPSGAAPLTLTIPGVLVGAQNVNVEMGTILEVAGALHNAYDATTRTLLLQTKLTALRALQGQTQQTEQGYNGRLNDAYDRLVTELDPEHLDIDATNLSIKEIEDAVTELEANVPLLAEKILGFRADLAAALAELPQPGQQPPQEEPPAPTSRAPASFGQRLADLIRAPFRFGQQLAADVVGLIQSRRVKLK